MKFFGDTINQLILRENERLTVRRKGKHKVKRNRNKPRGPRQSTALSSMSTTIPPHALTDPTYLSSLLPNNSSSLPSNPFAGTQSAMPLTATRNPSATTATKRENSTLAGLLTPNPPGGYSTAAGMSTSNGTSQYGNTYPGQSLSTDAITNKPLPTPKSTTPMVGINAGLSSRSLGKGSRGGGAGGTAPKRLVRIVRSEKVGNTCLVAAEHRRKRRRRRLLLLLEYHRTRMFNQRCLLLIWKLKMIRNR